MAEEASLEEGADSKMGCLPVSGGWIPELIADVVQADLLLESAAQVVCHTCQLSDGGRKGLQGCAQALYCLENNQSSPEVPLWLEKSFASRY